MSDQELRDIGLRPRSLVEHRLPRDRQAGGSSTSDGGWDGRPQDAIALSRNPAPLAGGGSAALPHHLQDRAVATDSGSSRAMTLAVTATQPCVGVKPGRARWKKMALPRPRRRGEMFQSSTRQIIVEPVGAAHGLVACAVRDPHRPVVVAVIRHLAPAEIGVDRRHAAAAYAAAGDVIAPEIARQNAHGRQRRRAVAFALGGGDAAPPERAGKHRMPATSRPCDGLPGRARTVSRVRPGFAPAVFCIAGLALTFFRV